MIRWECPNGEHPGAIGAERPARRNMIRYCVPCSVASGTLTERIAPSIARRRETKAEQRRTKAARLSELRREQRKAETARLAARTEEMKANLNRWKENAKLREAKARVADYVLKVDGDLGGWQRTYDRVQGKGGLLEAVREVRKLKRTFTVTKVTPEGDTMVAIFQGQRLTTWELVDGKTIAATDEEAGRDKIKAEEPKRKPWGR